MENLAIPVVVLGAAATILTVGWFTFIGTVTVSTLLLGGAGFVIVLAILLNV